MTDKQLAKLLREFIQLDRILTYPITREDYKQILIELDQIESN